MLAELLEELTPQLVRRVQARIAASSDPERAPARSAVERSSELLQQLVATLRGQRIHTASCESHSSIGLDVEPFLRTLRLLKECVYDAIEERGISIPAREVRLVADWFGGLNDKALREENRRFAAMLDALPDQMMLHDIEGRFVFMNRAAADTAAALSGIPRNQLLGRKVDELVGLPEPFIQYIDAVTARARGGESVKEEFLLPGPDGGRWREHHLAPVRDAAGKVEAIAVASRDIHPRKVAEARLQLLSKVGTLAETTEYEGVLTGVARLSIPELADWCIIDVVEDGHVRRGKVAHRDPAKVALAEEILQFSPELSDLSIGRDTLAGGLFLVGELDDAGMRERDPKFYDVVRRLGASSVMIIPFVVLGAPIAVATFVFAPESGRRHGPEDLALAQELARRAAQIIENARLHERLRQSEARFRVALERSNIAVFEEDTDFRVRWMYNAQLGAEDRSPVDHTAALPFEVSAELETLKRRVLETGEGARTAVDAVVRGERRHLLINFEPLRGVGGVVGITGAAVDITEAKRIQEELAQALAFRERVMGILGHDLRNPLSSVLGLSGLLQQQEGLSGNAREGLKRIEQSAERMNEMIGTILDFTELRFRKGMPLSLESVELDALARTIVDELRVAHSGRAIEIDARGDLRGQWDGGRIAQVVSNLVGNALTHGARESPVQISLSADEGSAVLVVSNRGPTIPEKFAEHLFEPFWQAPVEGDALRPRGLGLGLFIARQIVLAHGGKIDVLSRDDVTTFTVRLPRAAAS